MSIDIVGISKKPFLVTGRPNYHYKIDERRKSLDTPVYAEAVRLLNKLRKMYADGKLRRIGGECAMSLKAFADEYNDWAAKSRNPQSARADALALRQLIEVAGESIRLDALSQRQTDDLIAECRERGLKAGSINNYLRTIRALFGKAVDWQYLKANPFRGVKELPKERGPALYIEAADVTRFLASIQDQDERRLVAAYVYSGRRRSELLALEWDNISLTRQEYFVGRSKPHLAKWYPMHAIFRAVLVGILADLPGEPSGRVFPRWSHPDTISHIVKRALVGYGLGHLHLHHMRHTFATLLVSEGVDLATIGALLGHTDRRATDIYAHVTGTREREAIRLIKGGPVKV
jgi:integrase